MNIIVNKNGGTKIDAEEEALHNDQFVLITFLRKFLRL